MLQYEKIDVSKRIDINESNKSKECMICCYWYFKDIGDNLSEPYFCNKCDDMSMMAYELEHIAILNVSSFDYTCVLWNMTKNDAINRLNNSKLDRKGTL